jgi:serine/threonine-protein kinase
VPATTTLAGRLSLRAPIANEEERALFQRRLALAAAIVFMLAFGFYAVQFVSTLIIAPDRLLQIIGTPSGIVQLTTSCACGSLWLILRRGKRSVIALSAIDFVAFTALCCGWAAMIIRIDRAGRPEMIGLMASTFTLVVRAAFIPSTPARTALLGATSLGPLLPVAWSIYHGHSPGNTSPLPPEVHLGIWILLCVAATTAISYVVHGLRVQVRKAMQLGQYVLEEKIGEGGMGVVYRASHALLRRPAAIKLLNHDAEHGMTRFEREVQITAKLTHPNTVAVFDYGRTPDGTFYYAMEFLDGVSLEELVESHGPQPARRVVHILLQAAGALEEAHANGLVHRDIKPANIMLTERGLLPDVVKVLDFGLVKDLDGSDTNLAASNVNTLMGTPHYMSPEAIVDPANIDGRADLYALGATAYFLLTGERVFDGANLVEVCSQHLHQEPKRPSRKQPEAAALDAIVLACLAKKREDRPKDAAALAAMLEDVREEIGEWTREEARAWWAQHPRRASGASPNAKAPDVSVLGKTIAVALDDRRGAA